MFQVRVIHPEIRHASDGRLLREYKIEKWAHHYAEDVAMNYYDGVVVYDTSSGMADWGDGWETANVEELD